eukprot:scaffold424_cov69-Phaeocystis_antarctica.AAC.5
MGIQLGCHRPECDCTRALRVALIEADSAHVSLSNQVLLGACSLRRHWKIVEGSHPQLELVLDDMRGLVQAVASHVGAHMVAVLHHIEQEALVEVPRIDLRPALLCETTWVSQSLSVGVPRGSRGEEARRWPGSVPTQMWIPRCREHVETFLIKAATFGFS